MIKPSDYFALALRIVGVIIFVFGFRQLVDLFLGYLNYIPDFDTTFRYYVIISLGAILISLYLIRGAPLIVDYAYPDDDEFFEEDEADANIPPETVKDENDVFNGQGKI